MRLFLNPPEEEPPPEPQAVLGPGMQVGGRSDGCRDGKPWCETVKPWCGWHVVMVMIVVSCLLHCLMICTGAAWAFSATWRGNRAVGRGESERTCPSAMITPFPSFFTRVTWPRQVWEHEAAISCFGWRWNIWHAYETSNKFNSWNREDILIDMSSICQAWRGRCW